MNNSYCKSLEEAKNKWKEKPVGRAENFIGKTFGKWQVLYRSEVQNNRPYWVCKCECGNYGNIKGSELKSGNSIQCTDCQHKAAWKDYTGMIFGKLTVLNEYEKRNRKYYWKCLCECGNATWVFNGNLTSGEVKSCGCLSHEYHGPELEDLTGKTFYDLIVLKYDKIKNGQRYWKCQCKCGNITYLSTRDLNSGKTKSCGCRKYLDIKPGDVYGYLTVIKKLENKRGTNGAFIYKCKCKCGNEIEVASYNLQRERTRSCGCMFNKSFGEDAIVTLLTDNDIDFKYQQRYDNLKAINGKRYSFDFYVNNNYIIEYDGSQHFYYKNSGWDTKEHLLRTRQADLIKNKYCFDNNIPLIRIPYDAEYTIDDLKLETTRFLLTPENEQEYYSSRV